MLSGQLEPRRETTRSWATTVVVPALCFLCLNQTLQAQTTAFTYQGRLAESGLPANGQYDFTFKLYDLASDGTQIGADVVRDDVQLLAGLFTVTLDFGASPFTLDTGRFLEISVRPGTSTDPYTVLAPRQPLTSSPYSVSTIRAMSAAAADDALQLGGVAASQYVQTTDPRLTDDRNPLPDSPNYIQNRTTQQPLSDFNISGNGTASGTLTGNVLSATTQYNIGGNRVLSVAGFNNLFAGVEAGQANTANQNSFFGRSAGQANTTGSANAFFGAQSGRMNTAGSFNAFFGSGSGLDNTGSENSFFGYTAGRFNTSGSTNSFFGKTAGFANTTGSASTFLGYQAGGANTQGQSNTFVGAVAGDTNTTGSKNTLVGSSADVSTGNLNYATAIGADSVVSSSNTLVLGRIADTVQIPGNLNLAGSFTSNVVNATTQFNIGGQRVLGVSAPGNLFVGLGAGQSNSGFNNTFVGDAAGAANTTGVRNTFFGTSAGSANTTSSDNSFFGNLAGTLTTGPGNSFFGASAGGNNSTGANNSFFGLLAGLSNTTGSSNTIIGDSANVGSGNLSNATAIGAGAIVSTSNTVVLGRSADTVRVPGGARVTGNVGIGTTTAGATLSVGAGATDKLQVAGADGDVSFTDDQGTITFPAADATNAPMIQMFASGGLNGDRMVIAHSPVFTNYGLQFQDSTDQFNFIGGGFSAMTVDLANLRVGVGTSTPASKLSVRSADNTQATNVVDIQANNLTQGVGIGFDSIRKTGTIADSDLLIDAKGAGALMLQSAATGIVKVGSGAIAGGPLAGINANVGSNTYVAVSDGTKSTFMGADTSGNGIVGTLTAHPFVVRQGNVDRMLFNTGGDVLVGAGTAVNNERLLVSKAGAGLTGQITVTTDGGDSNAAIYYDNGSVFTDWMAGINNGSFGATDAFYFRDVTSGTTIMKLDQGANGVVSINISGLSSQRLCHSGADGLAAQFVSLRDCSAGGADLAEYSLVVDAGAEPGALVYTVGVDPAQPTLVRKALTTRVYQPNVSGIISTAPFVEVLAGDKYKDLPNAWPIALAGRAPVKVSLENGPILAGDPLVPSSTPGVAMKGDRKAYIVGYAEEAYDGSVRISQYVLDQEQSYNRDHPRKPYRSDPSKWPAGVGKVMAQFFPTYYDVDLMRSEAVVAAAGDATSFATQSPKAEFTFSGSAQLTNGSATVAFDRDARNVISGGTPLKVIVTLTSGEAAGVYVADKSVRGFAIHELAGGKSNATFDWIAIARRKGFDDPPVPLVDLPAQVPRARLTASPE